jgi:hypothetical protein
LSPPVVAVPPSFETADDLLAEARRIGEQGEAVFMPWFKSLFPPDRDTVKTIAADIKSRW